MKASDFEVGQGVVVVLQGPRFNTKRPPENWYVVKVGRKWVSVSESMDDNEWKWERFSMEEFWHGGFQLDGGDHCSPGMVYLNKNTLDEIRERVDTVELIKVKLLGTYAWDTPLETLRKIKELLGD